MQSATRSCGLEHDRFCWIRTDHSPTFVRFGRSVEGRYETVETWARMGFRRGPAVNARTRDAGDDHEYRCRTRPLLVGPCQGQANGPGPGPGLHVRHAVSADLFHAIGLADRCGGAAGDDRPA